MYRLPLRRLAAGPSRLAAMSGMPAVPRASWSLSALRYKSSQSPRPSQNTPTPSGLETVFGGKAKRGASAAKPDGGEPSAPNKEPEAPQPGAEEEGGSWAERRPRLSDELDKGGKGGGGGGGGGKKKAGTGGPGGPGWQGMTPNQLLLAVLS